jgi:hypothetical protein
MRDIFERNQERLDVIRHLTRGDYQHSHGEGERRIDERLQASHLDSAQLIQMPKVGQSDFVNLETHGDPRSGCRRRRATRRRSGKEQS